MANFVSPNQIQIQTGLVLLVRPDTRDDTSQPCILQWGMAFFGGRFECIWSSLSLFHRCCTGSDDRFPEIYGDASNGWGEGNFLIAPSVRIVKAGGIPSNPENLSYLVNCFDGKANVEDSFTWLVRYILVPTEFSGVKLECWLFHLLTLLSLHKLSINDVSNYWA